MVTVGDSLKSRYRFKSGLVPLVAVANVERKVQKDWINTEGNFPTASLIRYVRPLIRGRVRVPLKDGVPAFARLRRIPVAFQSFFG